MIQVPYGYKIEKGIALIDEPVAGAIRVLFAKFIECKSMRASANAAGIKKTHSIIGRIISNNVYLGNDFYPQLIDQATFDKAQAIRYENAINQNRLRVLTPDAPLYNTVDFKIGRISRQFDDPYKQAAYAYSQVEEVSE